MLRLEIIVNVDTTYEILEESDLIEGFSVERALSSKVDDLASESIAGQVNIKLSNLYNDFTKTLSTAKYKHIKNGQRCVVYNDSNVIFKGYITDYKAPTTRTQQSVDLKVVDALYSILNTDLTLKDTVIQSKQSLKSYLILLFTYVGLNSCDYNIDSSLDSLTVSYAVIKGMKLSEQLRELTKAADCYIYADADGIIQVIPKNIKSTGDIKKILRESDTEELTNTELGASYLSSYRQLKVKYTKASKSDVKKVSYIKGLDVVKGKDKLENIALETENLYELDNVKIIANGTSDVYVTGTKCTASTITLDVNTSAEDTVDIEVYGREIERKEAFIKRELEKGINQTLEYSSVLIQSKTRAKELADKLEVRLKQDVPYIKIDVVDINCFSLDVGQTVEVIDEDLELNYKGYIHSIDLEYTGNGACDGTLNIKGIAQEGEGV